MFWRIRARAMWHVRSIHTQPELGRERLPLTELEALPDVGYPVFLYRKSREGATCREGGGQWAERE